MTEILNLFNHELCCEFHHILITSEIDLDSDTTPLCGAVWEVYMAILTTEYTDVKNIKHKVEHSTVSAKEGENRERIMEELFSVLTKTKRHIA